MKVEKKKAVEIPRSFSNPTVFHPDRMICYCNLTFIGSIPQNNLHMHARIPMVLNNSAKRRIYRISLFSKGNFSGSSEVNKKFESFSSATFLSKYMKPEAIYNTINQKA